MLPFNDIISAANVLTEAMNDVALDLAVDDVADEEDFSGQLIGRWKERLSAMETEGSRWNVKASITEQLDGPALPSVRLSSRQTRRKGAGSEESWSGADILVVVEINTPDYQAKKGILIQSKRLEKGKALGRAAADGLRGQCRDMLNLSASSFVFVYSETGVTALSAALVEGAERRDLHELEQWPDSATVLFMDFFKCWAGDPRLKATNRESLAILRSQCEARNAVLIEASEDRKK